MKRFILLLLFTLAVSTAAEAAERWVAYYGDAIPAEKFADYDVIVFDSDSHPKLTPLQQGHKIILGYISLGEAENYRPYYHTLEKKNLLLEKNPQWPGHRVIDVRKQAWGEYVNNTLIPPILAQGFDGIMMDTIESPIDAEEKNPRKFNGMKHAAIDLVKSIRQHYPHIKIMINRGFEILPDIGGDIDMVMAESIYTDWQSGKKKPVFLPEKERQGYVDLLKTTQKQFPSLKIYTIDYWLPEDKETIKKIYDAERKSGFVPYVSTLSLQSVYKEPE